MLRSLFFSLATLAVITVAFLLYWRAQPNLVIGGPSTAPVTPATSPSELTQNEIGPGSHAWMNSFDEKGRLASQFRADEYTPQKDRSFRAVRPVWIFYLDDGQFMVVTGDTGIVYVEGTPGANDPNSTNPLPMSMQSPDHGVLQRVHLALFPSRGSTNPTLWLDVNNVAFDNDTLRLYTQGYVDESGTSISADQVPVTVRGDDYEFDGTGLTLNWNDRDRRLQLLEIAHGGRLMVKNPAKMSGPWSDKSAPASGPTAALPVALVSADPAAAGAAISAVPVPAPVAAPASAPSTAPAPKSPYHAVFNDAVRVEQGDRQVAAGDTMTIDFLQGGSQSKPKSAATSAAVTRPVVSAAPSTPEDLSNPKPPAAAEKLADSPRVTAAIPQLHGSASKPTAPIKNPPVTIYWTGKLRITPLESEPMLPLIAGQAVVQLVGAPVELTPVGAIIHAAAVTYRNDGAVVLENSAATPLVEMKQDRGMTFVTESLRYDPATQLATILGRSDMQMPVAGKPMSASWTRRGVIHFTGNASQPESADRVDLDGHVTAEHADFSIKSDQLALDLQKIKVPTTSPAGTQSEVALKRAVATGNVFCSLLHPGRPARGIDGDKLVLETAPGPDGKPQPRTIVADGNVRTFDSQQQLTAGHLQAVLLPTVPKPAAKTTGSKTSTSKPADDSQMAVEVESVYANSNVHAMLKGGALADADELRMTTKNAKPDIELRGGAESQASISDGKGSTMTGPLMHILPDRSLVTVDGPGALHSDRKSTANRAGRPTDVSWTDSMTFDGSANMVDAIGHVKVTIADPKGPVDTITGDTAHLDLADVQPSTKPSLKPAKPTTQPDSLAGSFGGDKELRALLIQGNVHGDSTLRSPDGLTILRQGILQAPKLTYDARIGKTEVPGPGWLTVEDHRKEKDNSGTRGAMAIRWQDSLVYDEIARQVVIRGNTLVVFQRDEKDAAPMHLKSQRLTVDLAAPVKSATGPSTTGVSAMQISHMRAEDHVQFDGHGVQVFAQTIDDDPVAERIIARGTEAEPVQVFDDQGASKGAFTEVVWNSRTQEIESTKGGGGIDVRK